MTIILRKLYFDIFFVFFNSFSFLSMIITIWYYGEKIIKFISVIFISSNLVFYVMYLSTNKWIYKNIWLLNTIFANKFQFFLALFTHKLLEFWTFCFQLIVQLLSFSLVRFLTNNNFHTFEAREELKDVQNF